MSRIKVQKSSARRPLDDKSVHRATWGNAKCLTCGGPPVIELRCLILVKELMQNAPDLFAALGVITGGRLPTVETKYGQMAVVSAVHACANCRKEAEKTAAKAPSWALVEINQRIPNSWTHKTIQVPMQFRSESK